MSPLVYLWSHCIFRLFLRDPFVTQGSNDIFWPHCSAALLLLRCIDYTNVHRKLEIRWRTGGRGVAPQAHAPVMVRSWVGCMSKTQNVLSLAVEKKIAGIQHEAIFAREYSERCAFGHGACVLCTAARTTALALSSRVLQVCRSPLLLQWSVDSEFRDLDFGNSRIGLENLSEREGPQQAGKNCGVLEQNKTKK